MKAKFYISALIVTSALFLSVPALAQVGTQDIGTKALDGSDSGSSLSGLTGPITWGTPADLGLARSSAGVLKVTDGGAGFGSAIAAQWTQSAGYSSLKAGGLTISGTDQVGFNATNWATANDVGLKRGAAGRVQITDGGVGYGNLDVGALYGGTGGTFSWANTVQAHRSDGSIVWAQSTNATDTKDVGIHRHGPGAIDISDGGANANGVIYATVYRTPSGEAVMSSGGVGVAMGKQFIFNASSDGTGAWDAGLGRYATGWSKATLGTSGTGAFYSAGSANESNAFMASVSQMLWSSTEDPMSTKDVGLKRAGAAFLQVTDGGAGLGLLQASTLVDGTGGSALIAGGLGIGSAKRVFFSSTTAYNGAADVTLGRFGAAALAIGDGASGTGNLYLFSLLATGQMSLWTGAAYSVGLQGVSAGLAKVTDGGAGSGSIAVANGTASAPSFTFASAPTVGMYLYNATTIGFGNNGAGLSLSTGTLLPLYDNAYDVGTPSARYKAGYFSGAVQVNAGGATATPAKVGGVLSVNTTAASNTSTGETTLMSYTIPANTLNANGRWLRITIHGTSAANANTKTIKVYLGSTPLTFYSGAASAFFWNATIDVFRTGANAQLINYSGIIQATSNPMSPNSSATQTDTADILFKVTGQGGASNDLTQTRMTVEVLN